ncbi:uncharacterized protein LOC115789478 [Archocentrus centrarchus]|uniref:uncharacterized protein LOC115789478 n=1 Tax=Archocentrus centrarchus TaxID=63155 RepID=UPI0011E9D88B|nr:uncharacterized protein LOC115789478 [Archocentrus centrarchus]XP_030598775.1 uncharacterized protein LOC115789478 [Archocentrus centrarchus]
MFAAEAKEFIKKVGGDDLIYNESLHKQIDLLTLVKVSKGRFWPVQKYKILEFSLPELTEEEDFSSEYTDELFVSDFMTSVKMTGRGGVGGNEGGVYGAEIKARSDSVDGLHQPVSMKTKKVNLKALRTRFRTINVDKVSMLALAETDKLAFVHQTIYNFDPVTLIRKHTRGGSILASWIKMLSLFVRGSRKMETSFTVPEKTTFAYSLMEIKMEAEKLKISCEPWTRSLFDRLFSDDINSGPLQLIKEELERKEALLQPLAHLPRSTRPDLLKKLSELVEDEDALSLLEQTLDQCSKEASVHPRSHAVSSFMDLLDVSNISTAVKDAAHLLVSALDALPGEMSPLLTSCSPDTLRVLSQLVDGLKDGQAKLPESLPAPLQEGGDLRWAAELICLNDKKLKELSDGWDRPELPPEVLLELLCLAVQGLSLMQPRTKP